MIILFTGRIIQALILILMTKILTSILPPSEYTKVILFFSMISLAELSLSNPVYMFFYRNLNDWLDEGTVICRFKWISKYIMLISSISGIVIVILNKVFKVGFTETVLELFIITFLYILFFIGNRFCIYVLNLLGKKISFVTLSIVTSVISLFGSFVFVKYIYATAYVWLIGQAIGFGVGLSIAVLMLKIESKKWIRNNVDTKFDLKSLMNFSVPLSISVCLFWVQMQSYRFLLNVYIGSEQAAYFLAGYNVAASIINSIELVLTQYLQPKFYYSVSKYNEKHHDLVFNNYARMVIPIIVGTCVYILLMSPFITRILLSSEFYQSYQFVSYGAIVETIRVLSAVIAMVAHIKLNSKSLLKSNLVGAFSSLVIGNFLISQFGNLGAGWTLIISNLLSLSVLFYSMKKLLKFSMPLKSILISITLIVPLIFIRKLISIYAIKTTIISAVLICGFSGLFYLAIGFILIKISITENEKSKMLFDLS